MGKFSKKIKRDRTKQAEKDLAQKVNMFDRLPDSCTACSKPFDKLDREMVMSWNVVVKDQDKQVNLYCPPCWEKGKEMVKEIQENLSERTKK